MAKSSVTFIHKRYSGSSYLQRKAGSGRRQGFESPIITCSKIITLPNFNCVDMDDEHYVKEAPVLHSKQKKDNVAGNFKNKKLEVRNSLAAICQFLLGGNLPVRL